MNITRRQFTHPALVTAATSVTSAAIWVHIPSRTSPNLAALLQTLHNTDAQRWQANGRWSVTEILQHLAQSIDYAITGYPQHKSTSFKALVGTPAFYVFSQKNKMQHPLNEPIPGAPMLDQSVAVEEAMRALKSSIENFILHQGPLAPHFAYGVLSKTQFSQAHVMHIQNHLQELSLR